MWLRKRRRPVNRGPGRVTFRVENVAKVHGGSTSGEGEVGLADAAWVLCYSGREKERAETKTTPRVYISWA
jgi:hypothetical protein